MRIKRVFKKISVTESVHKQLKKDRDEFQQKIGGGRWSISDVINEYFKVMKQYKAKEKLFKKAKK